MSKIIKRLHPEVIRKTAARCRKRGIVLPTFKQLRNPELIPPAIQRKLKGVGLWDVNPVNLFRITWKNDVKTRPLRRRELPGDSAGHHRREGARHRAGRKIFSHRRA